jgi:hypothetical protein
MREFNGSGMTGWAFRGGSQSIRKLSGQLATLHHLLGVGVECVIDDPLSGVERMIVFVAEMPEAFGRSLQPGYCQCRRRSRSCRRA